MKIRTGFVSNSSSSSYVLLGYRINFEEANTLFKKYNVNTRDGFYEDLEELMRVLENELGKLPNYFSGDGIDGTLIGLGRDMYDSINFEEIDLNVEKEFFENLNFILFDDNKIISPTLFSGSRMT